MKIKEAFLETYSYLTEKEYDETKEAIEWAKEMGIEENELSVVTWPESQICLGHEGATLINDDVGYRLFGDSAYLVPDELIRS